MGGPTSKYEQLAAHVVLFRLRSLGRTDGCVSPLKGNLFKSAPTTWKTLKARFYMRLSNETKGSITKKKIHSQSSVLCPPECEADAEDLKKYDK